MVRVIAKASEQNLRPKISAPPPRPSLQESLDEFGVTVPYNVLQLYSGLDGDQAIKR